MYTSFTAPDTTAAAPWINLDSVIKRSEPLLRQDKGLETIKSPEVSAYTFEAFKLSGIGSKEIISSPLNAEEVESFRKAQKKCLKEKKGSERAVIFLKIDPALRDQLLHTDISLFPKTGILPDQLSELLRKIGIGEERLVRVINLSATGRYTSEQNHFHSFSIPEHTIINQDLDKLQASSENHAVRIFKTDLINVIYNREFTLVVHSGESPTVNQFERNLKDERLEYFKTADKTPCVTTLLKDIIEKNGISCQRVYRTFHQFKLLPFRSHDTAIVAAFKMALAELQNYVVTQEDPISSMEKLLCGIRKDSAGLGSLLNKPSRFEELLEEIQLTTRKTLQLDRALTLREDARRAGVETRSQYISATLAALGSAFLPNATITQLPITDWKLQVAAHAIATLASLCLLIRMRKLGWFDFVTENFGDLLGLSKLKKFFRANK